MRGLRHPGLRVRCSLDAVSSDLFSRPRCWTLRGVHSAGTSTRSPADSKAKTALVQGVLGYELSQARSLLNAVSGKIDTHTERVGCKRVASNRSGDAQGTTVESAASANRPLTAHEDTQRVRQTDATRDYVSGPQEQERTTPPRDRARAAVARALARMVLSEDSPRDTESGKTVDAAVGAQRLLRQSCVLLHGAASGEPQRALPHMAPEVLFYTLTPPLMTAFRRTPHQHTEEELQLLLSQSAPFVLAATAVVLRAGMLNPPATPQDVTRRLGADGGRGSRELAGLLEEYASVVSSTQTVSHSHASGDVSAATCFSLTCRALLSLLSQPRQPDTDTQNAVARAVAACSSALVEVSQCDAAAVKDAEEASLEHLLSVHRACERALHARRQYGSTPVKAALMTARRRVLLSHWIWIVRCTAAALLLPVSPQHTTRVLGQLHDGVRQAEALWVSVLPETTPSSADKRMNHRTIHTRLNLDLAHLHADCSRRAEVGRVRAHRGSALSADAGAVKSARLSADSESHASMSPMEQFHRFWMDNASLASDVLLTARSLLDSVCQVDGAGGAGADAERVLSSPRDARVWVMQRAVAVRLCLNVEERLLFACAWVTGMEWATPSGSLRAGALAESSPSTGSARLSQQEKKEAAVSAARDTAERARWVELLGVCDELRLHGCRAAHHVFIGLVQRELRTAPNGRTPTHAGAQHRNPPTKPPSREFLARISGSFFPLAREHYLCTGGLARGAHALHSKLLACFLEVFLTLSSAVVVEDESERGPLQADAPDGPRAVPQPSAREAETPMVCGTTLGQATEVAVFLTLYRKCFTDGERVPAGDGGDFPFASPTSSTSLLTASTVRDYVARVFLALGHNTAKQLRHLRGTGALFYFTGERKDRSLPLPNDSTDPFYSRHVQSTLAVVHAHVMHPSLLWMPLWQLQEMVFLFAEHVDLFYVETERTVTTARDQLLTHGIDMLDEEEKADGDDVEGAGEMPWSSSFSTGVLPDDAESTVMESDGATDTASDLPIVTTKAPVFTRATIRLAGRPQRLGGATGDTNLSQVHGYLVLRLYVVSNVLRAFRDVAEQHLPRRADAGLAGSDVPVRTGSEGYRRALQRLEKLEPVQERKKRQQYRLWAHSLAQSLWREFPSLPVDTEGVNGVSRAARQGAVIRVLNRCEDTVRHALASHLFFNVVADSRRRSRGASLSVMADGSPRDDTEAQEDQATAESQRRPSSDDQSPEGSAAALSDEIARACGPQVDLTVVRATGQTSLGIVMNASTCCITELLTSTQPSPQSEAPVSASADSPPEPETPFGAAAESFAASVRKSIPEAAAVAPAARAFVGWRIAAVDGKTTSTAAQVAERLHGKTNMTLTLACPPKR